MRQNYTSIVIGTLHDRGSTTTKRQCISLSKECNIA